MIPRAQQTDYPPKNWMPASYFSTLFTRKELSNPAVHLEVCSGFIEGEGIDLFEESLAHSSQCSPKKIVVDFDSEELVWSPFFLRPCSKLRWGVTCRAVVPRVAFK